MLHKEEIDKQAELMEIIKDASKALSQRKKLFNVHDPLFYRCITVIIEAYYGDGFQIRDDGHRMQGLIAELFKNSDLNKRANKLAESRTIFD